MRSRTRSVLALFLNKLSPPDVRARAACVCRAWRAATAHPEMWEKPGFHRCVTPVNDNSLIEQLALAGGLRSLKLRRCAAAPRRAQARDQRAHATRCGRGADERQRACSSMGAAWRLYIALYVPTHAWPPLGGALEHNTPPSCGAHVQRRAAPRPPAFSRLLRSALTLGASTARTTAPSFEVRFCVARPFRTRDARLLTTAARAAFFCAVARALASCRRYRGRQRRCARCAARPQCCSTHSALRALAG